MDFIFIFLSLIFIQALLINGIYLSASGSTRELPDGSEVDSEMILYPVRKYLTQYIEVPVYYSGKRLTNLIDEIKKNFSQFNLGLSDSGGNKIWCTDRVVFKQLIPQIEAKFNIKSCELSGEEFCFYVIEKKYKFSKYLRKPIIECIACMPSFWGSITYWIIFPLFIDAPVTSVYSFVFWVVDILVLVPACLFISNKIK